MEKTVHPEQLKHTTEHSLQMIGIQPHLFYCSMANLRRPDGGAVSLTVLNIDFIDTALSEICNVDMAGSFRLVLCDLRRTTSLAVFSSVSPCLLWCSGQTRMVAIMVLRFLVKFFVIAR